MCNFKIDEINYSERSLEQRMALAKISLYQEKKLKEIFPTKKGFITCSKFDNY